MTVDSDEPFISHGRSVSANLQFAPIALFMLLLPVFSIPTFFALRPPAASLFLLLWACIAIRIPRTFKLRKSAPGAYRIWLISFVIYCLASAAYGYWNLHVTGKLTLGLGNGDIEYFRVVADRLLQIVLMVLAFEVVGGSQYTSRQLMRWWLRGLMVAVILHILTYLVASNTLAQRAGTFNEGNIAGLYYLLSVFVALEYRRITASSFYSTLVLIAALVGVLLSRSTASMILVSTLLSLYYCVSAVGTVRKISRIAIMILLMPIVVFSVISFDFDLSVSEKLFEQDVTSQSFSRIDRLESVRVAIVLFFDNPFFGLGLQTYGFLSNDLLTGPLAEVYDWSFRRIPNNVYAELASELGLMGLLLFLGFIVALMRLAKRAGASCKNWLFGILGVLLYWNAFPTYSVVFVWVFFGLVINAFRAYFIASARSDGFE